MASGDFITQPLEDHLYRDDDDEQDITYKKHLDDLVNGRLTPSEAAIKFDKFVVDEANIRRDEILRRETLGEEAEDLNMDMLPLRTDGSVECIFIFLAHLCSAYPPYHPGQNAIIEFLHALKAMPRHESYCGPYETTTLWPLEGNWEALPEIFRHENDDNYSLFDDEMKIPWSKKQIGFRNFQSAAARIASLGGQWIIWPDQGRYVYRECKKRETVSIPREIWCMAHWREWKEQFASLIQNEKFELRAKEIARLALQKMVEYEEEDAQ
ncbi:hypothetical protein MW887_011384 [Aspergillus wentii]|nr:hypothetical protein MW887_011384 [Aspergillus wentii]